MGGIEVIDPRYRGLHERAVQVLGRDARVMAVELWGSVAAGTADEWSDLDLVVVTRPDAHEDFLGDWPQWLGHITPTVFARTPIAPFIINSLTAEGLTLDIAVHPGQAPVPFTPPPGYTVGLLSSRRVDDIGAALEYAVAEQLRGLAGPFISLVQREEHLRHLTGIPHLVGLLTVVFLAETGSPPPGKQWNDTFTEEQRAAVSALPPVSATREGVVGFGLALAELLITRARPQLAARDIEWPAALAATAAARVQAILGLDVSTWLH